MHSRRNAIRGSSLRAMHLRLKVLLERRILTRKSIYIRGVHGRSTGVHLVGPAASPFMELAVPKSRLPRSSAALEREYVRSEAIARLSAVGARISCDGRALLALRRHLIDGQPELAAHLRRTLPPLNADPANPKSVIDRLGRCPTCGEVHSVELKTHCRVPLEYEPQITFDVFYAKRGAAVLLQRPRSGELLPDWWQDVFHTARVPVLPMPVLRTEEQKGHAQWVSKLETSSLTKVVRLPGSPERPSAPP